MPEVSRRTFLKAVVGSGVAAALAGCQNPRRWVTLEPYVRPPEEQLPGVATWYASTCHACPAGCGIVVRVMNGRALKIEGNPGHPLNQGKLCARGQAELQRLYHPDRLPGPMRQAERGSRNFQPVTWEEALNTLISALQDAGSRVAIWEGAGTPTHLHHLFRRFTDALVAPAPVRHDLYATFFAAAEASGASAAEAGLPAYDLGQADVILSFVDFLTTWHSPTRYGVEFGRFREQSFGRRGTFIQVEPRMSATGAKADLWLPARPGSETLVAQAIVQLIADAQLGSAARAARAQTLAAGVDVDQVAAASDLSRAQLEKLAHLFATATRPVALPGPGASLGAAVRALNAIAAAGTTANPVFSAAPAPLTSLTPALASPLAAIEELIAQMRDGNIDVLIVHGDNPAYDLPTAAGFAAAVANVPLVVSCAPLVDETAVQADLILPDHTPLESWGYQVVTPNFGLPIVGSRQPVVLPLYDTRATADVLLALAARLPATAGALPWQDEAAYVEQTIRQLPAGANGGDSGDVAWARFLQHGGWWSATTAPALSAAAAEPLAPPSVAAEAQPEDSFLLHPYLSELMGDGSGAALPWLQCAPAAMTTIAWQSWVELHPDTATDLGVDNGDVVVVRSPYGEIEVPVYVYPAIRPDTVALALGQGHTDLGRYARDRGANVLSLLPAGAPLSTPVPVHISATGRHIRQGTFENVLGVREGFANQDIPG